MKTLFACLSCTFLAACQHFPFLAETAADKAAVAWAEAYYSCDFPLAQTLSTPESERWLRFSASNVDEKQLQTVKECGSPDVDVERHTEIAGDSLSVVTLDISNVVVKDAIGVAAHRTDDVQITLTVVKRQGKWLVRMEGLPQNGRQNRD